MSHSTDLTHQQYSGKLSFATNVWTSPNHKAYVTITVHLEKGGQLVSVSLDLVEVPKLHTGMNLAHMFADVLVTFGIENKVNILSLELKFDTHMPFRYSASQLITHQTMT